MTYQQTFTKIKDVVSAPIALFIDKVKHISMESLGWAALLLMHAVTVPTMLGLMTGLTDSTPPVDMVLILWAGLGLLFAKAILQKDIIPIVIIGGGFIGQALLMALVFFK